MKFTEINESFTFAKIFLKRQSMECSVYLCSLDIYLYETMYS